MRNKTRLTNSISIVYKVYLAILFILTLVLFYIPIYLLLGSEKGKRSSFKVFVLWNKLFCFLSFFRLIRSSEYIVPQGPYIIIANHTSFLDIVFMYLLFPREPFLFLGKAELLKVPLIKTFFKKLHIPVYRNSSKKTEAFHSADKALQEGWSIILFPEGGIKEKLCPDLQPFKDGAFRLAKNNNVPIIPVTFLNNHLLLEDPAAKNSIARPGKAYVTVHPFLSKDFIANSTKEELLAYSFSLINAPLLEKYGSS